MKNVPKPSGVREEPIKKKIVNENENIADVSEFKDKNRAPNENNKIVVVSSTAGNNQKSQVHPLAIITSSNNFMFSQAKTIKNNNFKLKKIQKILLL